MQVVHKECRMCFYCLQACGQLSVEGEDDILPEDYIIVVFRYGMAQELLWRVSWALHVIGHNIVDLSDFNWLSAIRRQRREM